MAGAGRPRCEPAASGPRRERALLRSPGRGGCARQGCHPAGGSRPAAREGGRSCLAAPGSRPPPPPRPPACGWSRAADGRPAAAAGRAGPGRAGSRRPRRSSPAAPPRRSHRRPRPSRRRRCHVCGAGARAGGAARHHRGNSTGPAGSIPGSPRRPPLARDGVSGLRSRRAPADAAEGADGAARPEAGWL